MDLRDEEARMEFVFVREDSVSQQEKMRAFWKFLDHQNYLQPQKGTLEHESSSEAESSMSSTEEAMNEKDAWQKGLEVFQQLGLDKTALAADKKCRPCQMHRTIRYNLIEMIYEQLEIISFFKRRCEDLADTITQPYEELNADMKAFDERQKNRGSNQCEAPYAGDRLNQCNSYYPKTKK